MLEDNAVRFVMLGEARSGVTFVVLMFLSATLAITTDRGRGELLRAPYFARSAAVAVLMTLAQLVYWSFLPAVLGGYLWVLVAISWASALIGGFAVGRLSAARSRDAFGHRWWGFLAFVPLANLWLLLKRSLLPLSGNRVPEPRLLSGAVGVAFGVFLLMGVQITNTLLALRLGEVTGDSPAARRAGVILAVRSQGLEAFLQSNTDPTGLPIAVDDATKLVRIDAEGKTLLRILSVDLDNPALRDDAALGIRRDVCAEDGLREMIRQGATIAEVYVDRAGREFGRVSVDALDCATPAD